MDAPLCPMCSRVSKISTIEPHPTRDREDVVTFRCLVHGDISVVNGVEAANMDVAKMLPADRGVDLDPRGVPWLAKSN